LKIVAVKIHDVKINYVSHRQAQRCGVYFRAVESNS
jgi:hypothetical protein